MKLLSKLTLFVTGSKMLIVVIFVLLLPALVNRASFYYTNYYLGEQQKKVMAVIAKDGVDYYLQGDSSYGSYTLLKEEYISIGPASAIPYKDTIVTAPRVIEDDTISYRVLSHNFRYGSANYQLEIGKTTATIGQYNSLLQKFTLFALVGLIAISILIDLIYTHILLRPLDAIVRTKLIGRQFPFRETLTPVKTSTVDFRILDSSLIGLMEKIHEAFEKEREFTSNASHELMTPISILQNHAENMMMDESLTEEQQEKVAAIMKTLSRLRKIVHSLLYISRIENEQFAKTDTVNCRALVEEVMEELSHRLEPLSIVFSNKLEQGPTLYRVNHDLLFQLFYNLVNNAIRYNQPKGTITITGEHSNEGSYTIHINDTGTGIRQQDLPGIFNRFKRSAHTNSEGFGLGLSIVQSIVTFHGATVSVDSEFGIGTRFSVHFPEDIMSD